MASWKAKKLFLSFSISNLAQSPDAIVVEVEIVVASDDKCTYFVLLALIGWHYNFAKKE